MSSVNGIINKLMRRELPSKETGAAVIILYTCTHTVLYVAIAIVIIIFKAWGMIMSYVSL